LISDKPSHKTSTILKPLPYKGLFLLVPRGAKLRSREPNQIWYLLLSIGNVNRAYGSIFNQWRSVGQNIFRSRWLSTDVARCSHHMRILDKLLMVQAGYEEQGWRESSDYNYTGDSSDFSKISTLVYLEGKQTTSASLQGVRYVVMNSLSTFKKLKESWEKVLEPVRSRLHLLLLRRLETWIKDKQYECLRTRIAAVNFVGESSIIEESQAGALLIFPMPLTRNKGAYHFGSFQKALFEMYLCMLHEKTGVDPTTGDLSILDKILKEEYAFRKLSYPVREGFEIDEKARRGFDVKAIKFGAKMI
jgi:hypothetical protein